jgi:hypothetical protein
VDGMGFRLDCAGCFACPRYRVDRGKRLLRNSHPDSKWNEETMTKPSTRQIVTINAFFIVMLLVACADSPVPSPQPNVAPTETTSQATATPEQASGRISIAEPGISFDMPDGWQRPGDDWTWIPASSSNTDGPHIGVKWAEVTPGQEVEAALLPGDSLMLDRTPGPELTWGSAATYRLQVMLPGGEGRIQAVQRHVIVRVPGYYCDFSASAATEEALVGLESTLDGILASVMLSE